MTASNSKGVTIRTLRPDATPEEITPTSISSAKPAVVTTASTGTVVDESLVWIPAGATGMSSLDGKWWAVANLVADTSFELLGSDTTDEVYEPTGDPELMVYGLSDSIILCWATMTFNIGQPDSISTATFCDPTAAVPGIVVEAGTVDFTGYVDITDEDYQFLNDAYELGSNNPYRIYMPNNGVLIFDGVINSFSLDIPIDGAIGYSGQITLASKPRHLF